jgi:3-phenylpropionate/trans-cinnamate dioxygenase ferredoxin component
MSGGSGHGVRGNPPAAAECPSQQAQCEYQRACGLAELPEDGAIGVQVAGVPVAVVRTGGEVFALHDVCSHEEVPLSEGEIYDHTVECWLHGSCFDVRTGKPTGPPATKPVATYPVKIDGDDVLVAL